MGKSEKFNCNHIDIKPIIILSKFLHSIFMLWEMAPSAYSFGRPKQSCHTAWWPVHEIQEPLPDQRRVQQLMRNRAELGQDSKCIYISIVSIYLLSTQLPQQYRKPENEKCICVGLLGVF